ncbi:SprT-like family-domain-containing protein [Crucibulum laeve]|uniref:SprT-like family-domain-containing protein n=1 Tax=Crucibulum laeve TaxID=68775 RepID=A0A5C3MIA8_9AGAR|nr:SprT-like family-domain-containing protein [Crucibulum laeve]
MTSIPSPMNVRAEDSNDDSILTLGARRPLYVDGSPVASKSRRKKSKLHTTITEEVISTPAQPRFLDDVCNNGSPAQKIPSKKQTPRQINKAHITEEQFRLEAYAQQIFTELNKSVFEDKLPKSTILNWNKRLLSTAGRAKWHRSKEGVQTTEIELAAKILDCEERIRNTLSHEMCHLATWIIDADPKETHGKLWKTWTAKVMLKRPEITISTRHDYDISYPYQWKCELCSKVYGRFSKSIRPDECVCGSCKEGKLVPLFATRQRAPKTPKTSKMAAIKANDSPCSITPVPKVTAPGLKFCTLSESDSDIEILVNAMGSTAIVD